MGKSLARLAAVVFVPTSIATLGWAAYYSPVALTALASAFTALATGAVAYFSVGTWELYKAEQRDARAAGRVAVAVALPPMLEMAIYLQAAKSGDRHTTLSATKAAIGAAAAKIRGSEWLLQGTARSEDPDSLMQLTQLLTSAAAIEYGVASKDFTQAIADDLFHAMKHCVTAYLKLVQLIADPRVSQTIHDAVNKRLPDAFAKGAA